MKSRMRTQAVGAVLIIGLFVVLGEATRALAQDVDLGLEPERRDIALMFRKLGRGAVNVLTGWVEVPANIAEAWAETDPFTAIVVGGVEGIGWGFVRTATGVYEVVTFPFPFPDDYEPIIRPEFILPAIWGEPAPFMTEPPPSPADSFR